MVKGLKFKSQKELKSTLGLKHAFSDPDVNKAVKKAANKASKVIKKEALPTAVSLGLPVAQMGATALGTYLTGNPEAGKMIGDMSGKVAKGYIPDKYESKNKYIQMLSEGIGQIPGLLSGEVDPQAMQEMGGKFLNTIQNDIFKGSKKNVENYSTPYDMQMEQTMNPYMPQQQEQPEQPVATNQPLSYTQKNDNISNAPIYTGEDDTYDDEIKIKTTPYQQKEGSAQALMGSGLKKKKRGRPRKNNNDTIMKVEIIKKHPSTRYSGARNTSLEQLLEETERKQSKQSKQEMRDLVKRTGNLVDALGFGLRPKKGSQEAKEWGQKMKAARDAKRK